MIAWSSLGSRSQIVRLRGRAVLKAVRRVFQPGRILSLRLHEAGDVVGPATCPAAMIGRPVHVHDRHASCPRRTVPRLAFSVGHGCLTDRFAGHGFHSEALRHGMRDQRRPSIAVLEAPAVIAGLDDVAIMRQAIEHGSGHPSVAEYLRPIGKS
jgi:hypothetical protein